MVDHTELYEWVYCFVPGSYERGLARVELCARQERPRLRTAHGFVERVCVAWVVLFPALGLRTELTKRVG